MQIIFTWRTLVFFFCLSSKKVTNWSVHGGDCLSSQPDWLSVKRTHFGERSNAQGIRLYQPHAERMHVWRNAWAVTGPFTPKRRSQTQAGEMERQVWQMKTEILRWETRPSEGPRHAGAQCGIWGLTDGESAEKSSERMVAIASSWIARREMNKCSIKIGKVMLLLAPEAFAQKKFSSCKKPKPQRIVALCIRVANGLAS